MKVNDLMPSRGHKPGNKTGAQRDMRGVNKPNIGFNDETELFTIM